MKYAPKLAMKVIKLALPHSLTSNLALVFGRASSSVAPGISSNRVSFPSGNAKTANSVMTKSTTLVAERGRAQSLLSASRRGWSASW